MITSTLLFAAQMSIAELADQHEDPDEVIRRVGIGPRSLTVELEAMMRPVIENQSSELELDEDHLTELIRVASEYARIGLLIGCLASNFEYMIAQQDKETESFLEDIAVLHSRMSEAEVEAEVEDILDYIGRNPYSTRLPDDETDDTSESPE